LQKEVGTIPAAFPPAICDMLPPKMPDSSPLSIISPEKNKSSRAFGDVGEELAAAYLRRQGYVIVMANFTVPVGRNRNEAQVTAEIDLVALDDGTLCFIEVKTRTSEQFAPPLSAIDVRKQRQITRAAKMYRRIFNVRDMPFRYDAVTVVPHHGGRPKIELVKGFWTEARFKKRYWRDGFQEH
jgi:putative endonuclease